MEAHVKSLESPYSVHQTIDRLEELLRAKGIKIFARLDQAAEALAVGISMRPTELLIFGDPKTGSPLMIKYPSLAIDLPLKALAWESEESRTGGPLLFPSAGRPLTNGIGFWRGAINLASAIIDGTVELSGAELNGALRLDHAEVKQDFQLLSPTYGNELRPCQIRGAKDFSIDATALRVGGSMRT